MSWYKQLPFGVYSILLSLSVGFVLWISGITGESAAILSALGLEIVVVSHRVLADIERLNDPSRGLIRDTKLLTALSTAREIIRRGNPQATALLQRATSAYADRVRALSGGGFRCTSTEFIEIAEELFGNAKPGDVLRATSHLAGGSYWQQTYGRHYEQMNEMGHRRGMRIERIYLLRDTDHLAQVRPILDRQASFSDVRVVLLKDVDGTMDAPRRDFFVFNQVLTAEFVFSEPGMVVDYIWITTDADEVRKLSTEYVRIRNAFSVQHTAPAVTGNAS